MTISNQVDILCYLVRNKFKNLNVIGVGGFVDSIRLRQVIYDKYKIDTNAFMIGYHKNSMFPLFNSIKKYNLFIDEDDKNLQEITKLIRDYGMIISIEQGYGSSILPAFALIIFVNAYLFNKKLINCYNIKITDKNIAKLYDVEKNTCLSIPLKISYKKIEYFNKFKLSNNEKSKIKDSIKNLKEDLKIVLKQTV